MKFAMRITETFTRTVIVEADNYVNAHNAVIDAFNEGKISLNYDNSNDDMIIENDTDNYIEIFGKDVFESLDVSQEFEKK